MKHSCDGQYLFVGPCYVFGTTLHLSQVMRGHLTSHYSPREQGMPKKKQRKKNYIRRSLTRRTSCEFASQVAYTYGSIASVHFCLEHGVRRHLILSKLALPDCISEYFSQAISVVIQKI